MFVVMSNNGDWDRDMVGVVGTIGEEGDILQFIQKYGKHTDQQIDEVTVYGEDDEFNYILEENSFSYFGSMGRTVLAVKVIDEDGYEDFYFVDQF